MEVDRMADMEVDKVAKEVDKVAKMAAEKKEWLTWSWT